MSPLKYTYYDTDTMESDPWYVCSDFQIANIEAPQCVKLNMDTFVFERK